MDSIMKIYNKYKNPINIIDVNLDYDSKHG